MKKIMFNDKLGLTQAVIEGRKTMTRRFLTERYDDVFCNEDDAWIGEITRMVKLPYPDCKAWRKDRVLLHPKYKVGEIVAVAQSYESMANGGYLDRMTVPADNAVGFEFKLEYCGGGYKNKMFVSAALMPHHIRITDIKVERLQDISDEDCMKEGVLKGYKIGCNCAGQEVYEDNFIIDHCDEDFKTAREAFAALIDKVSGKSTWKLNPWVFVYEFKLVD